MAFGKDMSVDVIKTLQFRSIQKGYLAPQVHLNGENDNDQK